MRSVFLPFNCCRPVHQGSAVDVPTFWLCVSCFLQLPQPTNHLDLNGVFWLQHFLSSAALKDFGVEILVIVSHDRSFLDAVVTDVIMFVEQKLTTFPGTVSEYFGRMSEREDHMSRLRDAKHKQEKKMQAFIASAQSSSSKKPGKAKFIDPKKQKAGAEQAAPLRSITWCVFTVFCAGISQGEESEAGKAGLVPFRWQTVCAQGISSE
jgi:hypothetical protein